jgi:hypothetical protein
MTAFLLVAQLLAADPLPVPPPPPPAVAPAGNAAGELTDADPRAYTFQLSSSSRFAPAVQVRLANEFPNAALMVPAQNGGEQFGWTWAPLQAIRKYTLAVTRRHFEDAKWGGGRGSGKELVVRSVNVVGSPGPSYQVQVVIDREDNGKRLGQATGTGHAQTDRKGEKEGARWGGYWARGAYNEAVKPRPEEDATTIAQATLRALDHALLQLSAASYVYTPPGASAPPPPPSSTGRVASGKDPTQQVGATAAIKVVNGTSLQLCDVRIWKDAAPGHTDRDYNFIRNSRIAGGQFKWLLDGIPSSRYHFTAHSCDGTEVMNKDLDLKPGDNAVLVK